jgi:hemoglobin/transferrin/lactoferrin receptor protein
MKSIKFILFFAFCFVLLTAKAQNIKIIDASNLQPINNVTIFNKAKNILVETDNKGDVDISKFGESDTLFFKHLSFQPYKATKSDLLKMKNVVRLIDNIINLDEVVFSANKSPEKMKDLPNLIEIITAKDVALENPQTTAEMLSESGSVFVQKSQMGGGSPILRGFEANRVLLVIDGVRMNNAIYRVGHLQNIITIDPLALEKTELLFGPGAVMYGSDAIGGVVSFYTKNPELSTNGKLNFKASAVARYSSANTETGGSVYLNFGLKKYAGNLNVSYKKFGDLRTGAERNPFYGDWGKCLYYTERINNKDSMMSNADPEIQKFTGYSQIDILHKSLIQFTEKSRLLVNIQISTSSDIPRYDRTNQMSGSTPAYSEWYYGPNNRGMLSLNYQLKKDKGFFDVMNITGAGQYIDESRIQRKFGKSTKEHRLENVIVGSLNVDFDKKIKRFELRYGIEGDFNTVKSEAYGENINTGDISYNISSRYPDAGNQMITAAAYITDNWEIGDKLIFSQGIRFNYVQLNSAWSDTMMKITKFPFGKEISQQNSALNGSLGLVYLPGYDWKLSTMISTGFRAPNVDDISKVNDSKGSDRLLIIPNPDLKPEYAYNADLTIEKTFSKKVQVGVTGFYTILTNAIVLSPTILNGADSVIYDGKLCAIQANENKNRADVYGIQANLNAQLTTHFSMQSNITYTFGEVISSSTPLDHIPPVYGRTSFKLEISKFIGEFYILYNGWKKLKNYSLTGEDNLSQATIYGTPSWYTLNAKLSYQPIKYLTIQVGCENILDSYYRCFASGVSAPGRNFVVALRGTF